MADQIDEEEMPNPLLAACFHGNLQFVKLLTTIGADVNEDVCNATTPLMTASALGHCQIVRHLLRCGAMVNKQVLNGNNAVHECVKYDSLKCLKILVKNGAQLDAKFKGMTPLLIASSEGKAEIVEYLISLASCTRAAKIEALELLGAYYVDEDEDFEDARYYWMCSLEEREGAVPGDNVPPKREEPHPAFDAVEFQTEEELNMLETDMDKLSMQSLLIRERIFGPQHSHTVSYILRRATDDADEGNIERSTVLLTYILNTLQNADGAPVWELKEYCLIIDLLSNVMFEGSPVKYKDLMAVFIKTVDVLEQVMKPYENQPWNSTTSSDEIWAIVDSVCILARLQSSVSEEERLEFANILHRLVDLNVRDHEGDTLLQLASKKMSSDVVQLLLPAGAEPEDVSDSDDSQNDCIVA